ncbi:HelD family protein [Paraeggerthella hominis]|uniref:HelD family protein n=1 Tax=Paraeggerthella hominis TaxID=2897351 RepID=UPI001E40E931|nr:MULTISPECIES: UvrD-helicase domain-containing protein [Paraeggerthella]MCD2433535.1 UvrD-helicase domain-containing protein [Paraeggerthella hominis]
MHTDTTHLEASPAQDPVFEAEQRHLSETYATLRSMAADLVAKMDKNSKDVAADKLAMVDELSVNLASYADAMETYADFATVNRVIDAYNMTQSVDAEKLNSIRLLLGQPYFAKVVLQFKPGEDPKELYIGTAGVSDDSYRRLVVDWRSPVAEVYYNQDNGPTSYQANGRTINVDLKLRRQFDVDKDRLNAYFDTTVAIQDSLLLASLSKQRSAKMQSITATIQKEQNQVIRHEDVPALLVNGIAGSGKTSVLMQRIAYLFYQQRESLDPSQVFLITPNPVFQSYIDNVLPDLGERNPECLTWNEFLQQLMPPDRTGGQVNVALDRLERIDAACAGFAFDPHDFKEVHCNGDRLLSVGQILQVAAKFKNIPAGPHLVSLMRDELAHRLDTRLKQIATSDRILDELSALSPDEQVALFRETFDAQDEDEARVWAQQYVDDRYAAARKAVENDDWLRIDRIGMRLLGVENLVPVEWLYLKMALTGLGNPDAKYVMIDEVQDYTAAQLTVLARYFRRAHFLLLGDQNQAIGPDTATFDDVKAVFQKARGSVEECRLMTSYRSSPAITALFAGLLADEERLRISSIRRQEEAPAIIECATEEERDRELVRVIEAASADEGLTAVILPQKHQAKQLQKKLGDGAPPLIDADATLPTSGVVLTSLKLAKGLEFDHVIVPEASERTFPDDPLSRRRLYTTVSRATGRITLLAQGKLTPLLSRDGIG